MKVKIRYKMGQGINEVVYTKDFEMPYLPQPGSRFIDGADEYISFTIPPFEEFCYWPHNQVTWINVRIRLIHAEMSRSVLNEKIGSLLAKGWATISRPKSVAEMIDYYSHPES